LRHVTDLTHYTYPPSAGMAPKFEAVFPKPEKPENRKKNMKLRVV